MDSYGADYHTDLVRHLRGPGPGRGESVVDLRLVDQALMRFAAEKFGRDVNQVRSVSALLTVPPAVAGLLVLLAGWNGISWLILALWLLTALPFAVFALWSWIRYLAGWPRDQQREWPFACYSILENGDWIMAEWNKPRTQLSPVARWSRNGFWYELDEEERSSARARHDADQRPSSEAAQV
jgi:hypothetical protein